MGNANSWDAASARSGGATWNEGEKGVELYDHGGDAHEYRNLTNKPEYSKVVDEMRRLLREGWRKATPEGGDRTEK